MLCVFLFAGLLVWLVGLRPLVGPEEERRDRKRVRRIVDMFYEKETKITEVEPTIVLLERFGRLSYIFIRLSLSSVLMVQSDPNFERTRPKINIKINK